MPTKNTRKIYGAEQFYHVYSRGVNKEALFLEDLDYRFYLSLFKRYLSAEQTYSKARVPYAWFGDRIDLICYCLMSNHIHIFVYQKDASAMQELMHSIMTSYSMYFNKKYKHYGPVFQSRYLASNIGTDMYFQHITRYIHLNPKNWRDYPYSSLQYYSKRTSAEWVKPTIVLETFGNFDEYDRFLNDYEDYTRILDELKQVLAHD